MNAALPYALKVLILTLTATVLVIWVAEPSVRHVLRGWLRAPALRHRRRLHNPAAPWRVRTLIDYSNEAQEKSAEALSRVDAEILVYRNHSVAGGMLDELVVSAPDHVTHAELLAAAASGGGRDVRAWPATAPTAADGHSSSYFAHSSHWDLPLNLVVRLDAVEETAKVDVRGVVTRTNLRALYVGRRVVTGFPAYEVVVNLAHAGVTAAAFDELREHARQSSLSSGIDSSATPCRLRIVEPPVTLKVHEHAYALPSA
jgi:hypothetical protein